MEYLQEHPPAHVILAGVHMKREPRRTKKHQGAHSQMDELRREVMQLGGGIVRGPLPEIYRDK